jgi:hypothetical protein
MIELRGRARRTRKLVVLMNEEQRIAATPGMNQR